MLSEQLEHILQITYAEARARHHEFIGIEHLLLSLIREDRDAEAVLQGCGVNLTLLGKQLAESIEENTRCCPKPRCRAPKPNPP